MVDGKEKPGCASIANISWCINDIIIASYPGSFIFMTSLLNYSDIKDEQMFGRLFFEGNIAAFILIFCSVALDCYNGVFFFSCTF